jgi:hypothetical protein
MKASKLIALSLAAFAFTLHADEKPTQFDAATRKESYLPE